ncbi:trans-sialidase [Trypanosoma cruzi]|nr:trans-sialidase [Trypanosoma cruzi]
MGAAASGGYLWRAASRRCVARREESSLRSVPLKCCGRAGGGLQPVGGVLLRVPGMSADSFPPCSLACRRVFPAVDLLLGISRLCGAMCAGGSAWVVRRAAVSFCVLPVVSCVGAPWCVLTRGGSTRRGSCWWWQSLCVPGALFFLLLFRVSVRVSFCCWEWLRRG